jgi:hypothetical protein
MFRLPGLRTRVARGDFALPTDDHIGSPRKLVTKEVRHLMKAYVSSPRQYAWAHGQRMGPHSC